MRVVLSAFGSVFQHAPGDEVNPVEQHAVQDFIQFVGRTYKFAHKPILPQAIQLQLPQNLVFQSGKLVKDGKTYAFQQLIAYPNGDAISATTTENADLIMDDYVKQLDSGLNYRFRDRAWKRTYVSGLVVQFDIAMEDHIPAFVAIEAILNRMIVRERRPFKPKTISFGYGDPVTLADLNNMNSAEMVDFTLQRRIGEPYSENRYFSTAPLKTDDHIKMLEEIEAVIRRGG